MPFFVYNKNTEDHSKDKNNYYICRPNILGNPYTEIKDRKTRAQFICKNREEAIEKYSEYYDIMYGSNIEFTNIIDEIYEKYRSGENVYLGCVCKPLPCHGDVIVKKLQARLIKDKIQEIKVRNKY